MQFFLVIETHIYILHRNTFLSSSVNNSRNDHHICGPACSDSINCQCFPVVSLKEIFSSEELSEYFFQSNEMAEESRQKCLSLINMLRKCDTLQQPKRSLMETSLKKMKIEKSDQKTNTSLWFRNI